MARSLKRERSQHAAELADWRGPRAPAITAENEAENGCFDKQSDESKPADSRALLAAEPQKNFRAVAFHSPAADVRRVSLIQPNGFPASSTTAKRHSLDDARRRMSIQFGASPPPPVPTPPRGGTSILSISSLASSSGASDGRRVDRPKKSVSIVEGTPSLLLLNAEDASRRPSDASSTATVIVDPPQPAIAFIGDQDDDADDEDAPEDERPTTLPSYATVVSGGAGGVARRLRKKSGVPSLGVLARINAATVAAAGVDKPPPPPPLIHRHSSLLDLGLRVKDVSRSVKMAAEDELRHEAHTFADSTTAHGIPLAINAKKWYARCLWTTLSICSVALFIYQCILVFNKFQRKDKIVSVELQFENAPFPAVTICSLNPFKKHLARTVPEISETLDAYHQAVIYSKDAHQQYGPSRERRSAQNPGGFRYVQFEPVLSDCECEKPFPGRGRSRNDCIQKDTIPPNNVSLCICNYDRQDSTVWPCYERSEGAKWEFHGVPPLVSLLSVVIFTLCVAFLTCLMPISTTL